MALYYEMQEVSGLFFENTELSALYFEGKVVWEAGNFRTADGLLFVTADGFTFNTKE